MKKLFFLLLIVTFTMVKANETPSFQTLEKMPSSYAKDYYTWRLISQKKTTKKEALKAYKWTKRKSSKLRKAIRKKLGYIPSTNKRVKKRDPKNFIIYPSTASKKSLKKLQKLYKKIKKQGKYSDTLKVMSQKDAFKALLEMKPSIQSYIYNGVSSKYRKKHFNKTFTAEQIKNLMQEKNFNKMVKKIVTTPSLKKNKESLLLFVKDNKLTFQTNFYLAMNAVEFNKIKIAINYLKTARTKTYHQSQYDQVDFWLYLLTKDKKYLHKLLKSHDVNIYTLRARDILNKPYPKVRSPKFAFKVVENFDVTNPIDWEMLKIKIKKNPKKLAELAKKFESSETLGIHTYIKEKESKYQVPYFAMPYPLAMWGLEKERIALLYAIARQESRLVPATVSPSYALGIMQIMPFLVKHLAKERNVKIDLNDMFNPYTSINFANQHLNYLNKWLYHPLFVAYAYNGGIGFTKRTLKSNHLFKKGVYEPYLSMELIDFHESKEYAKKVLANYVIYLNLLGVQTKISPLLKSLTHPSQTDRFRK